jgi:putative ABC transport system permease protein
MGAKRGQIVMQFLSESVVLAVIALSLGVFVVWFSLPWLNVVTNLKLSLLSGNIAWIITGLFVITLIVGVGAGSYPAFVLSSFEPTKVLRAIGSTRSKAVLRRILVVGQFAIAIALIVCMGVVRKQVEYCRTADLGFSKEHIVTLEGDQQMSQRMESIKSELKQHPGVVAVGASRRIPSGRLLDSPNWKAEKNGAMESMNFRIAHVPIDDTFIPTYSIPLAAGRNFSKDFGTDSTEAYIVNETAVRAIGWASAEDAVGKNFEVNDKKGKIVGVVKDFHFESMREKIAPIMFLMGKQSLRRISIKVLPNDIPATLDFLRAKWKTYRPEFEFTYQFLDERFDKLYKTEEKLGQMFGLFAGIAVFVACLGLFGLATFTAERRTKEIAIRKVMGASVLGIMGLLTKEFVLLVLVANVVAYPLAYFAMVRWTGTFAYQAGMSVWIFVLASLVALGIALLTAAWQAFKAATANPVRALKCE